VQKNKTEVGTIHGKTGIVPSAGKNILLVLASAGKWLRQLMPSRVG